MSNQKYNSLAYKELRNSDKGHLLVEQSKSDAAMLLFDINTGDINKQVAQKLPAHTLFDAVIHADSLSIQVANEQYTLQPFYSGISESTALTMLSDIQATLENSLLNAVLMNDEGYHKEIFPSATKMEIFDVCMTDVVGDYDVPEDVDEWSWIEGNACFEHHENGEKGVWEFVINLGCELENIPKKLTPVIAAAHKNGAHYILFHQNT